MAAAGFLIARCAGKDKYFAVLDGVFHAQAQIYATGDMHTPILAIAKAAGLDEKAVDACLADEKAGQALNARVQLYNSRDGVTGTPTFIIGGQRLVGEQTLQVPGRRRRRRPAQGRTQGPAGGAPRPPARLGGKAASHLSSTCFRV